MKNFHKKAFSLIEISLVIVINGILIAGVSQGIDLYQDMRLATARSLTQNSRVNHIEDLTIWFEATSEQSFENPNPQDEERIALWKNINFKLSNRIDVAQSNQASKPFYVRSAINNIPALRFDNAQLLTVSNVKISEIVSSNQATVFVVQNNFGGDNTSSTFSWATGSRTTTPILTDFLNQNKIITFVKNSSNVKIKINAEILANSSTANDLFWAEVVPIFTAEILANSSTAGDSIDMSLSTDFSIGKFFPDNNYFFLGYIGEFIVFKRALTDAEIKDIEKYLSKKWSIKI